MIKNKEPATEDFVLRWYILENVGFFRTSMLISTAKYFKNVRSLFPILKEPFIL